MAAVGGSIESVSIGGRLFPVTADADAARSLGGFTNDVQANGNGTARIIKTRVPWAISGLTVEVDDVRADQEFLQAAADNNEFEVIVITLASGAVYQGLGTVTDKIEYSTTKTTADISLMGPAKLTAQ